MKKHKIYKFPNGATLIYQKKKSFNVTAVYAGFVAGHIYANGKNGLPHLVEHMLFKKTKKRTLNDILNDKSRICALNACTANKYLCVNFRVSNKRVNESMEFASDILLNSIFENEQLENEKNVVIEELSMNQNKHKESFDYNLFKILNSNFLYDEIRLGTVEEIKSYTIKDLEDFRKEAFIPSRFIASVTSSLSFKKIKKLIFNNFIKNLEHSKEKFVPIEWNSNLDAKEQLATKETPKNDFNVAVEFLFDCEKNEFRFDKRIRFFSSLFQKHPDLFYNKARESGLIYTAGLLAENYSNCERNGVCVCFKTSKFENIEKLFKILNKTLLFFKNRSWTEDDVKNVVENCIISLDNESFTYALDKCSDNLNEFLTYNSLTKRKQKQIIASFKKITTESVGDLADRWINKNNDVVIYVQGGSFENQNLKSISEYKKILFKGID